MFFEFHAASPPRPPGSPPNSFKIIGSHEVTFSPTVRLRKSFSCITYGFPRKCCKHKTYRKANSFRCNTYKKQGEGGALPVRSAERPFVTSLLLYLLTSSFLLTWSHHP